MNPLGWIASGLFGMVEWLIYKTAKDKGPFFDSKDYPWVTPIEENWEDIRRELDHVMQDVNEIPNIEEVAPVHNYLTKTKQWKSYFLYIYGHRIEENCLECPRTAELLKGIPGMRTAFFSILAPKKQIPPHRGPYNGVLRMLLGLKIPDEKLCRINIAGEVRHWKEGKAMLFDDSYLHYAENMTDEIRVVLFVDFVRPVPFWLKPLNYFVLFILKHLGPVREAKKYYDKKKLEKVHPPTS